MGPRRSHEKTLRDAEGWTSELVCSIWLRASRLFFGAETERKGSIEQRSDREHSPVLRATVQSRYAAMRGLRGMPET
jgi:tRNA(Arg) A34 adenosine deaminase TadA